MTNKSIYIWSKIAKMLEPEFMYYYLRNNNFSKALLSYSAVDSYVDKLRLLLIRLYSTENYILIGNNKFLTSGDIYQYLTSMRDGISRYISTVGISGIHLDIEPQIFSEYKSDNSALLSKYLEIVNNACRFCVEQEIKLEVSIPFSFPGHVLDELSDKCDMIYVMAYENIKPDYLERKITNLKNHFEPNQMCISVRTEDFSGRAVMDSVAADIVNKNAIDNICYSDLESHMLLA